MGTCPHCGKELREGAWVCGFCGEPLAQGGAAAEDGQAAPPATSVVGRDGLEYSTVAAPRVTAAPSPRTSRLLWLVVGAGMLAVLAVVLVWLFVLRDTGHGPFTGTWTVPGNDVVRLKIEDQSGYQLTFTDGEGRDIGPFMATLNGTRLESKLLLKGGGGAEGLAGQFFQSVLSSTLGDFTIVFTPGQRDDRLVMSVEGASVPQTAANAPVELQRAD